MIDALFGSKTRVKLLHLFLNNPGQAFYVREITRLIGEQINSVRRELSNMLDVGIITSNNTDNKLFYEVNQRYDYYVPMRAIFADQKVATVESRKDVDARNNSSSWGDLLSKLPGARVIVAAGILIRGSASGVDLLFAGDVPSKKLEAAVAVIEQELGRELTYSMLSYDEFYYRISVHDRFISDILASKHQVIVDSDGVLND